MRHGAVAVNEPGAGKGARLAGAAQRVVDFLKAGAILRIDERQATGERFPAVMLRQAEYLLGFVVPREAAPLNVELQNGERGVVCVVEQALAGLDNFGILHSMPGGLTDGRDDSLAL